MQPQMASFSSSIIDTLVAVAPSFVVVCIVFIVFTWLRAIVDVMAGGRW